MVLISLASLLNPLLPRDWPLEETQRGAARSAVHTQFSVMPWRAGGVPSFPPISSGMDGASLAFTGTVLKSATVCMPSGVAFRELPHTQFCAQHLLIWVRTILEFGANVSIQYSL